MNKTKFDRQLAVIDLMDQVHVATLERLGDPKNVSKGTWGDLPLISEEGEDLLDLFDEETSELERAIIVAHTHLRNRALIEDAIRECGDVVAVTGMVLQKLHEMLEGAQK